MPAAATMTLPFGGISSLLIKWGDTTSSTYGPAATVSHPYSNAGNYKIIITGAANSFGNLDGYTGNNRISSVTQWGITGLTSLSGAFYGATNLLSVSSDLPIGILNMNGMFWNAARFNSPINNWNTSSVRDMDSMFRGATAFNQPLNNWNTSSVTTMYTMFYEARLFNQPLNTWNTSNVENMGYMFYGASSFVQNISGWNTSKIYAGNFMFCNCPMSTLVNASNRPPIAYVGWISSCS